MSLAQKWMKLESIVLSKEAELKRSNTTYSASFMARRPKVMMTVIMGHECYSGTVWREMSGRGEGERKGY
jgi:hypothetical protein